MLTKQCKMKIYFSAIFWPQQIVIDMHIDEWNENGKTLVKSRAETDFNHASCNQILFWKRNNDSITVV